MTRLTHLLTVPTLLLALTSPVWAHETEPEAREDAPAQASAVDSFLGGWMRDTAVQLGVGIGVGKLSEKAGDLAPVVAVIPAAVSAASQFGQLSKAEAQAQAQAEAQAEAQARAQAQTRQIVPAAASNLSSMIGLPF